MPSQSFSPGQKFDQNLSQSHLLAPEQRQRVELLQAPSQNLEQHICHQLEQNPHLSALLEVHTPDDDYEDFEDYGEDHEVTKESAFDDYGDTDMDADFGTQDWEVDQIEISRREEARSLTLDRWQEPDGNDNTFDQPSEKSITERLDEQIRMMPALSHEERRIARRILSSLSAVGFFDEDVEEFSSEHEFDPIIVQETLTYLQLRLEPAGLAACDKRECLLLQLERKMMTNSLAYRIIKNFYQEAFQSESPVTLAKMIDASPAEVQEAFNVIRKETTLFPVIPDHDSWSSDLAHSLSKWTRNTGGRKIEARLFRVNGEWVIESDRHALPIVRINPEYEEISTKNGDGDFQSLMIEARREAKKWNRLLQERQSQMIPILTALAKYQNDYLIGISSKPRPLTYQQLADQVLGENGKPIHKSTTNRAALDKWIDTPIGKIEIADLFREKTGLDTGQSQSQVKRILQQLVDEENKSKPLSDRLIAEKLQQQGVQIETRTINKYRGQMGIPSTPGRKQHT